VAPAQTICQRENRRLIGPQFGKPQHAEEIRATEAAPELLAQLSRQCRDNFLAVLCAFRPEDIFPNPVPDAPIEQY